VPGSRLLTISTAGFDNDSVLGRLRARALALEDKTTDGPLTIAIDRRGSFALLEWAAAEDADLSDPKTAKSANPASWVSEEWLAERIHAPGVYPLQFARFDANVWTAVEAAWLPAGAWQALCGPAELEEGSTLWVGYDIGGERSGTAVATVSEDGRVHADLWQATTPSCRPQAPARAAPALPARRRGVRSVALSHRGAAPAWRGRLDGQDPAVGGSDDARLRAAVRVDRAGRAQRWHERTGPPSARREMVRVVAIAGTRRRP
jgi:hypothetical protein